MKMPKPTPRSRRAFAIGLSLVIALGAWLAIKTSRKTPADSQVPLLGTGGTRGVGGQTSSGAPGGGSGAPNADPTPTPGTIQTGTPGGNPHFALDRYLRKKDPSGQWIVRSHPDGRVRTIFGGALLEAGGGDQTARIAQSLLPLIAGGDAALGSAPVHRADGPSLKTVSYNQEHRGYEVYQSTLTLLSRASDGGVYLVNSDLRTIGEPDLTVSISQTDAQRWVAARFGVPLKDVKPMGSRPVLWATGSPEQLGWVFTVRVNRPEIDDREVVYGMVSKEIVADRSTMAK